MPAYLGMGIMLLIPFNPIYLHPVVPGIMIILGSCLPWILLIKWLHADSTCY